MDIRFLLLFFFVFFGLNIFPPPVRAHEGLPVQTDGCHECRAEDGCFFFDYWSVPRVTRHCHGIPQATAASTSISTSLVREKSISASQSAKVLRVVKGNTIEVEFEDDGARALVQLLGIQNPASYNASSSLSCADKMEKGSRAYLEDALLHKKVQLRVSLEGDDALADGTLLRSVFRGKTFINKKMLEDGYGIADGARAFEFASEFSLADAVAREDKNGLWNPEFCEEKKSGAFLGMLLAQISRYGSLPIALQYALPALGMVGIFWFGRLIRRTRVA